MRSNGMCRAPRLIVKPPKDQLGKKLRQLHDAAAGVRNLVSTAEIRRQKFRALLAADAAKTSEGETSQVLGMGAFASPTVPGFHGIFRQTWRDFCVTEMPTRHHVLSRAPRFTIPPLPQLYQGPTGGTVADLPTTETKETIFSIPSLSESPTAFEPAPAAQCTASEAAQRDATDATFEDPTAFTECYLHKKNVPHVNALSALSQVLRVSPRQITVAGIKDLIGDTVQRVRIRGVSPQSLREVNQQAQRVLRRRDCFMQCSDFSYHSEPLAPGDLFGNHFKIVLRDVTASRSDVKAAVSALAHRGFPNYYGCQRFSWFGGRSDAAFAAAQGDFLRFAFLFLDYCAADRTLRDLLQRRKKYPLPLQDTYRRQCIKMLLRFGIEPSDLDHHELFKTCPVEGHMLHIDADRLPPTVRIVVESLRSAFLSIQGQDRRLKCQGLCSYLWNQALTLRLKHFGAQKVLPGDFVLRRGIKASMATGEARAGWTDLIEVVTDANREKFTIADVVHPGFQFERAPLPQNEIGDIYAHLCNRYCLAWSQRHTADGIRDFLENPRPIIVKPLDLRWEMDSSAGTVTVEFALERGSYANVAVTELMKATRCVGQDAIARVPMPPSAWDLGREDPAYIETFEDVYPGFTDGEGFTGDEAEVHCPVEPTVYECVRRAESEGRNVFRPDPADAIARWSSENLVHQVERQEQEARRVAARLFEKPLADQMSVSEVHRYLEHTTEAPPNAQRSVIARKLRQRARRSAGTPRFKPQVLRRQMPQGRRRAAYRSLSKDTWNRHFT